MDELIRNKMHDALDVEAPDRDLRYRVLSSLPAREDRRRGFSRPAVQWAGGLVAALIAIAVVAGLLYTRVGLVPPVPSQEIGGPVGRAYSGMVTATTGWEDTNNQGHLMRTTDGGVHWTDVTPASFPQSTNVGRFFLDESHAWLAGTPGGLDATNSITVFLTTDGGLSWKQGAPVGIPGSTPTVMNTPPSVFFIDSTHGWLFVSGTVGGAESDFLYRTSDGGLNWQRTADSSSQPLLRGMAQVAFVSLTTGWLTGCGCAPAPLLVTHDGGATWKAQAMPPPSDGSCPCGVTPPVFFDPKHGMLLLMSSTLSQTLLMTSDGGDTWNARLLPGKFQQRVSFTDASHGWAIAGPDALLGSAVYVPLYHTGDGGRTWVLVPTNLRLETKDGRVRDLYFVDGKVGFAARYTYAYQPTQMLKTTDGGHTWTVIPSAA